MADELSQLDELIESDVLEALGEKVTDEDSSIEIDGITIDDLEPQHEASEPVEESIDNTMQELEADSIEETQLDNLDETLENIEQLPTENSNEKTINSNDLASLLSELLNNKTIEITIKIKD